MGKDGKAKEGKALQKKPAAADDGEGDVKETQPLKRGRVRGGRGRGRGKGTGTLEDFCFC